VILKLSIFGRENILRAKLTAGLKLNSMTVPGGSLMLFGEKVKFPPRPTSTVDLRNPPIGKPFRGEVLVNAMAAFDLNASIVFPAVGLSKVLEIVGKSRKFG